MRLSRRTQAGGRDAIGGVDTLHAESMTQEFNPQSLRLHVQRAFLILTTGRLTTCSSGESQAGGSANAPATPHLGNDADQTSPCAGRSWQPNGVAKHFDPRGHAKNTVALGQTRSALWARKQEMFTAIRAGLTAMDIRLTPRRLRV